MEAKYIAGTSVVLSVSLGGGKTKHVRFSPVTGGKSVYYTKDEALQKALERHARYGTLFRKDESYGRAVAKKPVKAVAKTAVAAAETKIEEVAVSDLGQAKDYLARRFGVGRSNMKTKAAILAAAQRNNIVFTGL